MDAEVRATQDAVAEASTRKGLLPKRKDRTPPLHPPLCPTQLKL